MNEHKTTSFEVKGPGRRRGSPQKLQRTIVKGQDGSQYRDIYHAVLTAPWPLYFLGLLVVFGLVNVVFASLYVLDRGGIANAHPGSFWDAFLFSIQTIGSVNGEMLPKSIYVNIIVCFEAFFGILNLALVTGVTFARVSRPTARVLFSDVAIISRFDGKPTLMFRTANQRGNQVFDASVTVALASQKTTTEGTTWRRFEELKLMRSSSLLFALSWTIMHPIDEASPLYGCSEEELYDKEFELIVLLRGTDETLADTIYARHNYTPDKILVNRRFVDVLTITEAGHRVVDLTRFHDTEPLALEQPKPSR